MILLLSQAFTLSLLWPAITLREARALVGATRDVLKDLGTAVRADRKVAEDIAAAIVDN